MYKNFLLLCESHLKIMALVMLTTFSTWFLYFQTGGFQTDPNLFGQILYFTTWALFSLWIVKLIACIKDGDLRTNLKLSVLVLGILSSIIISGTVFWVISPEYRVLVDEATLTSISYMMKEHHTATTLFMSRAMKDELVPLFQSIDKRPPLFPFFVHLIHWVQGYSFKNPMVANFMVLVALLDLIFLVFASLWGPWIAILLQLSVAAQPAVFLSATSAGFDLFSSFMMFLSLAIIGQAFRTRRESLTGLVLLTLALFSLTRYESLIIAGILAILFFKIFRPESKKFKLEYLWLAPLPLFLTPLVWLFLLLRDPAFHETIGGQSVFSLTHFMSNISDLGMGLFFPPENYPHLQAFYVLCLLAGGALVAGLGRIRKGLKLGPILPLVALASLVSLLITLFHFFGSYLHANALRLFLNFVIPFSLIPGVFIGLWMNRLKVEWLKFSLVVVATLFFYFALTNRSPVQIFEDIGATHRFKIALDFLKDKEQKTTVVISKFPTEFAILGFSSIDFETFSANEPRIIKSIQDRSSTGVYVFQEIAKNTGKPLLGEVLDAGAPLKLLNQLTISPRHDFRISVLQASEKQ